MSVLGDMLYIPHTNPQYVLNDLFFREILRVLSYEVNGVLIYDPLYYEVVDIFIGICTLIFNRGSCIQQHSIDSFFNSKIVASLSTIESLKSSVIDCSSSTRLRPLFFDIVIFTYTSNIRG